MYNKHQGFTLIELLIAIVIFAIIAIAAQSSLFNFSKSSKSIQNQIENIEKLQQLMIFLDRDFSQILDRRITLEDNKITITSIQNDNVSDIYYDLSHEKIIRTEEESELVFMEGVKKLKISVADNAGKLHTTWQKNNTTYLKALEIKFTSPFGEIIKMVLLNE